MPRPAPLILENATCLACGCLCDDISLTIHQGQIQTANNACPLGQSWFQHSSADIHQPIATIEGQPAAPEAALKHAAQLLQQARRPLITGLSDFPISSQRLAVALADAMGAVIDPAHSPGAPARIQALQRKGAISATLGEVKNRADVVVFWNVDPLETHPRHLHRYSFDPAGRFLTGPRQLLVASPHPTQTSKQANHWLTVRHRHETLYLQLLRQLVRGLDVDQNPAWLAASPSLPLDTLKHWAQTFKSARFGAFFHEPTADPAREEVVLQLIRDLNQHTRFVGLTLGPPANAAGAEAVLTWQTGYPMAVDFSQGYPRYLPSSASAEALLARQEADLVISLGAPGPLSPPAQTHLRQIPLILIETRATQKSSTAPPTIGLSCDTPGIHQGGVVMRVDGVTLPLRQALPSTRPTADSWLQSLLSLTHALPSRQKGDSPS